MIKYDYDAPVTTKARRQVPAHERTAVRLAVVVEWAYAALYVACVVLALARAADLAGHWHIPARDDAFTAGADITAGRPWTVAVGVIVSSAPIVAGLGLFGSALLFLTGYARGDRPLIRALIRSTVITTVVLAVSLTAQAQSLSGWLLD